MPEPAKSATSVEEAEIVESDTGLGLWVSNSIVQKYRGRIRLRSKINGGTVFSVFLPNDQSEGAQRASA